MDVKLYVYDLSKGLARMYSLALTGTQMDAIYHTSIVLDGTEYYFGQGIQTAFPGSTHHGHPMEVIHLGTTELPKDVIEEYIQSLEEIYSPESYDLFLHNCNNFTQDLSMFLLGKNIPDHIRNLPQTFLNTPFGQMMKPQIDNALRGVTQGTGTRGVPQLPSAPARAPAPVPASGTTAVAALPRVTVQMANNVQQLDTYLNTASQTGKGAVIFFTSATCPPCKILYPTYDELAEEAGDHTVLVKVDISVALDVGMKYGVRATPTFMTFLRGEKVDEWSGANPGMLQGNVRLLMQMVQQEQLAKAHPHRRLDLPSLQRKIDNYVLYKKVPPLDKVRQKLSPYDSGPVVSSIIDFLQARNNAATAPADTPIPTNLAQIATYLQATAPHLPRENRFALVDLARLLFLDPRVSGYFAERDSPSHATLSSLFSLASPVSPTDPSPSPCTCTSISTSPGSQSAPAASALAPAPYNLRMTLLQLACNLFTTPLYTTHLSTDRALRDTIVRLATSALLSEDIITDANGTKTKIPANLRVVAASCIYNLAALNHNVRLRLVDHDPRSGPGFKDEVKSKFETKSGERRHAETEPEPGAEADREPLSEEEQVEIAAAVIEALDKENESSETVRGLVLALALLVYEADVEGSVVDVCRAMGVEEILRVKGGIFREGREVISEVGCLFK
ncbi:bifunctional C97 family peptidase/thioredoxin family protein [Aspergillus chevalieri]|uniref:Thioredoxin n=1 Tax=Aspergillus chevalieri TaxID=182096 RepID=A0A7R7VTW2_ASPCH|nr:uncharacterized protein ACHE_51207S [Aspergillus chevalieri]BCR90009.1 hypothetical protein ACHE_51207S [Aspergillus chevalieri]